MAQYRYLGRPVMAAELTPDQAAVLSAPAGALGIEIALSSDIPGDFEGICTWIREHGWWVEIHSPFEREGEYTAGLTPQGVTGWNGRPDHEVSDATLRSALYRVLLLMLLSEKQRAATEPTAEGEGQG